MSTCYKLFIFFWLALDCCSFAQVDSSLANKITISGFCLCKTKLEDLKLLDSELQEIKVEEMDVCNDGFIQDGRFENRKGYYSKKYPGIIFQKDNDNDLISKIRLTKDFVGKLPDGTPIDMRTLLAKDVISLYPKFNTWGSRGCSDYWSLSNDTLSFFVKIDRKKQPQYPIDKAYYLEKPIEGIDLVISCYGIFHKHDSFELFPPDEPTYFIDSIRTNKAFINEAYNPEEIALISVDKDSNALNVAGQKSGNGTIYIFTKSYAREHYWEYFKSKSVDYLKKVPDLKTESNVIYILNGKPLHKDYEADLFKINDSNFIDLDIIDEKQLNENYNISGKKLGVLIKSSTNK